VGQSTVPPGLSNIVAMAAGQMHNLILKADGSVVTWGYGAYGLAQIPSAATNIVAVAAGDFHSLVLRSDGSVLAWGRHDQGQINVPGGLSNVVAIGHGVYHSLAIRSDGQLVVWGNSSSGQTNVPPGLSNVVIAAGVVASSVALGDNLPPQAISRTTNGPANRDLVLTLAGTDANGDLLSFRVSRMPTNGTLYQYTNGMRGAILDAADSIVGDANHRIVFAPATNGFGSPYTTFNFLVNDGDVDSLPALITINTAAPVTPAVVGGDWQTNGSFQLVLSGDSNTTYAVWTSTNLANWILLGTASPLSNSWFRYVDVDATNWPYRFYRSGTTQ